jgi:hypothetical protein
MTQFDYYTTIGYYALVVLSLLFVGGITAFASLVLYILFPYVRPRKED